MLIAFVVIAVAVAALSLYQRSRRIPDQIEAIGAFEIVTHFSRYMTGWNNGRIGSAVEEYYSLRYHGKPFTFDGRSGMFGGDTLHYENFNALITFGSKEPAVLLNVGDPNNSSFFYLIREADGQAVAQFLGQSTGDVSVDWIDPPPDGVVQVRDIARHRGRLSGGRWLLLGQYTVLDVQTLTSYPLRQTETAEDPSVNQFKPPMGMSPDRLSFVRFGYSAFPESHPLLIVYAMTTESLYVVPIRRQVERFNLWEELDAAWLDHYYEWERTPGAPDRLIARPGARPLPYRGHRPDYSNDPGYREYDLMRVQPSMFETLIGFIEREFKGQRQPPSPGGSVSLTIGTDTVSVLFHDDQVALFVERGANSTRVTEIGDRFDARLATGELDQLFLP